jgi:AraC-like DNA-binding protein
MDSTTQISTGRAALAQWTGLGQVLQAPPRSADAFADVLESAARTPRSQLPGESGSELASGWFRTAADDGHLQFSTEFLRMAPGAWLVFGEHRVDAPFYRWNRERQLRVFGVMLRGGAVFGFSQSPHQRFVMTEGHGLGIAYGSDTMICRTPLPGVRGQLACVYFENDEAMRNFGLDVREAHAWLSSAPSSGAAPGLRMVANTPNTEALKAARAICWAPYAGARRRLFLRSKAGEMICHLMANPGQVPGGLDCAGDETCDDASLAALAHEAASDVEHCPEVADVAARLHVSTGRLLAAFRAAYGKSLRDHMNDTRMALARRLLSQTNTPLLEVAVACGYEHHSSFSTAYRRTFNETPMQTRRAARH